MRLKTFSAKTMSEALASVRAEMGPEAIIISSHRGKTGGLFVRAALDEPAIEAKQEQAAAALREQESDVPPFPAADPALLGIDRHFHEGLVRRIRGELPEAAPKPLHFDRAQLLILLHSHRVPESLAHRLAEAAEKSRLSDMTLALASALDPLLPTAPVFATSPSVMMLAGPPGAGKTAIAGKLAAHARLAGRAVTLVAGDAEGAGAVARLQSFADHLNAKLAVAENADAIARAVTSARTAKDTTTIIDMAGFDPRDAKARTAFSGLAKLEGVETIAVVSATGDAEDLAEIVAALKSAGAKRLVVTGADLTKRLGGLISASTAALPLAHITRSPFIAGGLETPTPLSLARALLQSNSVNPDRGSKS